MVDIAQSCSVEGCVNSAAFRTRSKPTYCDDHITAMLRSGGLEPLEPFKSVKEHRLCRCLNCGVEAHYRFEYAVDQNAQDVKTCRACFWRRWAKDARDALGSYANLSPVTEAAARAAAERGGLDYLQPLTAPSLSGDPHLTRCQSCGRIEATRLADMGWPCPCLKSPSRASVPKARRILFKDSDSAALAWWHPGNSESLWETATAAARKVARWRCPGGHDFEASIFRMTDRPTCPDCERLRRFVDDLKWLQLSAYSIAEMPELLASWADERDPGTVSAAEARELYRWECPQGHHPRLGIRRWMEAGCPSCRGLETRAAEADTVRLAPELVSQWHPTKNTLRIEGLSAGSSRSVWWRDPVCGHEWAASPGDREYEPRWRCPECRTRRDSLAWWYPELAAEWAPENALSAWHVRPTGTMSFIPTWICRTDASHRWEAPTASRVNGADCPDCKVSGKSKVELAYMEAARARFETVASGRTLRSDAFRRRLTWTADILIEASAEPATVVEYDGSYWHIDKVELDTDKSLDLLAAGYQVVRLREHPLPPLRIDDPGYTEIVVYATAPQPESVIGKIATWMAVTGGASVADSEVVE